MGCWATTFAQLGGYNEKMLPMGYQEVDMRERTKLLPNSRGVVVITRSAGYSCQTTGTTRPPAEDVKHLLGAQLAPSAKSGGGRAPPLRR